MGLELGATAAEEYIAAGEAYAAGSAAAGSAAEGAAASSSTASTSASSTVGSYLLNLGANLALGKLLGGLLGGRPTGQTAQGALINSMSNVDPIPPLYGRRRIGGTRILAWVGGFNPANNLLMVVIVWGEGPISAVSEIYLDGVALSGGFFQQYANATHYLGTDGQLADQGLVANIGDAAAWNQGCTLSGIAYSVVNMSYIRDKFPGGMPTVTADVDGRVLYDPRTGLTAFSRNPALAIRDYLTNTRYGRGIAASMIDDTSFGLAADHCDETVSIPAGGTQARYTCDGPVNTDEKPLDNLSNLLTSCRGYLFFSGGVYKLKCEKADTPVSFTLNEDNILGAWSISGASKRTKFNRVRARFYDAASFFQATILVQESAAYRTQDNGLVLETNLELPFTTDAYRAQQLAQIAMKRSRFSLQVGLTATIAATALEVGDVVPLTHTTPGWVSKLFRVAEIELLGTDEVRLSLVEYDASAYNLDTLTAIGTAATMRLPDPLTVAAPGAPTVVETLYQTSGSAGVKSKATVSWVASADQFVISGGAYQVEYQVQGASSWSLASLLQSTITSVVIEDLAAGLYNFRVRAFNSLGVSALSATTLKEMLGLTAPPSNVSNFAVQSYNGSAKFTWSKLSPNGLDLAVLQNGRVFVRWSPKTGGASWDFGSLINPDGYPGDGSQPAVGPLMTGTYMAKAWNGKTFSTTEATFVVTEALITGLTTITTVTEAPTFSGTKTNVAGVDSGIQLDSTTLIDSMLTNIDTWSAIDSLGGVQGSGSYAFASKLDLGSKQACRLISTIDSVAFATDDMIDSRTDLIDSWGLVDGVVIEDAEVQLWVRHTDDDPNGAPAWSSFEPLGHAGDYNFRGFDFRLDFATGQATHNRSVTTLSVAAKH